MKEVCIQAVTKAAGRALKATEIKGIMDGIKESMQQLAREDNAAFISMTREQQLQAAAQRAADNLIGSAQKEKVRLALKIQRHDAIQNYIDSQKVQYGMDAQDSLRRVLAFVADGKSNFQSIETRSHAVANDYMRQMLDTFESTEPRIFGLLANTEGMRALTYELFGQDSHTIVKPEVATIAKKGAKAWNDTAELMRKHFNNAGGEIGKVENWRMPQNHSQLRVSEAGQHNWVQDIFPALDRRQYVNEDGSYFNDQQMIDFLNEAWTSIATGGANKIEPGKFQGNGMIANRHAEERSIHFKDADSYLDYHKKYGGADAYTTMAEHVHKLSRDIASIETLGPNPDLMFKYFSDKAQKEMSLATPIDTANIKKESVYLQNLYSLVSGKAQPIASRKIAEFFDTARQWLVATKLGSAAITSIADNATMHLTAQINHMSSMQLLRNQLSTLNLLNQDELRIARRAGLSLQTFSSQINRWAADNLGATFSKKMADLTLRASGLNAMTEGRRRAFGVTMYGSIGNVVRKAESLATMDAQDRHLLESKGITEETLQTWKSAELEDWGNGNDTMLTPEAIYSVPDEKLSGLGNPSTLRREAALKLMGMVNEEINMAIIEPGMIDRARAGGQFQRGTWTGEIARSFFLFKGMPMALVTRHFARGLSQGTVAGKALYIASLIAATTVLGAAAVQINNVISGRNPQDMSDWKFWAQSFAKGGSLGIYGDFVFNTNTQSGNSQLGIISGPLASYTEDALNLTHGNLIKYLKGEKTHVGADFIRFIQGNIPLQNLWYTKAVTDRLIFNQLQEIVSPGYMNRVEQRAQQQYKQSFWWRPGERLPGNGPDLATSIANR